MNEPQRIERPSGKHLAASRNRLMVNTHIARLCQDVTPLLVENSGVSETVRFAVHMLREALVHDLVASATNLEGNRK